MTYKDITMDFIFGWCEKNGKNDWLAAWADKTTTCKVYPRKKIVGEDGKVLLVADKSAVPTYEKRPVSFMELKLAFVKEFMPEIAPKKAAKKPTFHERLRALKG